MGLSDYVKKANQCEKCGGNGYVTCDSCWGSGHVDRSTVCSRCDYDAVNRKGDGRIKCKKCGGSGRWTP